MPAIENIHLAAELPVQRSIESFLHADRHHSILAYQDIRKRYRDFENLNPYLCQIRVKTQMKLFLKIKTVLYFMSGQYLSQPSSYGDPPGTES